MNQAKLLECIHIEPKTTAKLCVIWLHGLGADGNDFVPLVPQLQLPESMGVRFIFPHAPVRPVTLNNNFHMRAWYDIYSLSDLNREDIAGLKVTESAIHALIEQQIATGLSPEQILLAGFSQGGAAALYTGLRYPKKLAGIIALSTYIPAAPLLQDEAVKENSNLPIFYAHGQWDEIIPLMLAERSKDLLSNLHYPIDWHTYPMGHEVCGPEVEDLRKWLIALSNNGNT